MMTARIIAKSHMVSSVKSDYMLNGRRIRKTEYIINKSHRPTNRADRVVFRAIHHVGNQWQCVMNYLAERCSPKVLDSLDSAINKHTV